MVRSIENTNRHTCNGGALNVAGRRFKPLVAESRVEK
jgi:hypothetical protein